MWSKTLMTTAVLALCLTLGAQAQDTAAAAERPQNADHPEHHVPQYEAPPALARFVALDGEWNCTVTEPDGKVRQSTVRYDVTAGGSTVVETLFVGEPHEMVSMYHMDGDKLVMVHYCVMANQPHFVQQASEDTNTIALVCDGGANIPNENVPHMHEATYSFRDDGSVVSHWTFYAEGQPGGTVKLELTRAEGHDDHAGHDEHASHDHHEKHDHGGKHDG